MYGSLLLFDFDKIHVFFKIKNEIKIDSWGNLNHTWQESFLGQEL